MAGSSLKQALKSPEDDWTKTKDLLERKKIQNRLAQRKRRARLKGKHQPRSSATTITTTTAPIPSPLNETALVLHSYNTLRAFCTNSRALSIVCPNGHISMAVSTLHAPGFHFTATPSTPSSLSPTNLQLTVPHSSVIDCIPMPTLRDKLITVSDVVDVSEFGRDLVEEGWVKVWGRDSWDPTGWEIQVGFLKKWWAWGLVDDEMIRVANFWRRQRGEDEIDTERVEEIL